MRSLDQVGEPKQIEDQAAPSQGLSPLQQVFLNKMELLISKREEQLQTAPDDKFSLRLLSRALYGTYMDCVSAGVGDQANAMMDNAQAQGS